MRVAALVCALLLASLEVQVAGSLYTRRGKWLEVRVGSTNFSVTTYGAKGDGTTLDTQAIQKAFDAAGKNGGTVVFPGPSADSGSSERKYLTTEFHFSGDNTHMNVPSNVRVLFSNDRSLYTNKTDLITAKSVSNIAFSGGGILDGQGPNWWKCRNKGKEDSCFRPKFFSTSHTTHVLMQDITWQDSPNHVLEMYADYTEMSGVNVFNPPSDSTLPCPSTGTIGPSHNTDAVDVHGTPFYIHHCHFDTGDDNIAAHASNTLVEDCTFGHGHGASIGSVGDDAALSNITFRNIKFINTECAVKIKTRAGAKNAYVRDITWENLELHNVGTSIGITMFYDHGKNDSKTSLKISNITVRNLTAYGTKTEGGSPISPGSFQCQKSSPCHGIHLIDVSHPDLENQSASNDGSDGKDRKPPNGFVCSEAYGDSKNVTPKSCLLN
jgi:polygalacturonase